MENVMLVIRDAAGEVINFGPWDYMEYTEIDPEDGSEVIVWANPLPEGCTMKEEPFYRLPDGGLTVIPQEDGDADS